MTAKADLFVRSHVSRDVLQNAEMFKNEKLVTWEYVANGLQYQEPGSNPIVKVRLDGKKKRITVEDNGRGMLWDGPDGLDGFFQMHGENIDRKRGQAGRGRFGTGKAAAFGIGDVLRITTVRDGKRSKVELRRADLEAATSGEPIPVRPLEREASTNQPSGTLIEIDDIHLPRQLDQAGVIQYIERHLAHWGKNVLVQVGNHPCEVQEPPVERSVTFDPDEGTRRELGPISLTVKVSKSPLDEDSRGVSIYSTGVWHETTLLTSAGKDMSEFLFGEIDVPWLDDDRSTPSAFDVSRSMRLNPDNRLVQTIYAFVAPNLERIRRELVEEHRQQRETEEAKRLEREASQIEQIINSDFSTFRQRLKKVRASGSTGFDAGETPTGQIEREGAEDDFLYGGEEPAAATSETGEVGHGQGEGHEPSEPPRRLNPIVEPDTEGASSGHREQKNREKPRARGGFNVEFASQGEANMRATYVRETRTIYINLDFPQIAAAKADRSADDPIFRRLAYEVAFSEYAVAVASELYNANEFFDPAEAIFAIRDRINAVARQAAPLYR